MTELSDLPEDVIAKIWSLLPVKVVLRLKSVQKSWNILVNALAKTPSFVADHLYNSKNNRATSSSFIFYLGTNEHRSCLDMKHTLLTLHRNGEVNLSVNKVDAHLLRHNTLFAHCDGIVCAVNLLTGAVKLQNPATGDLKFLSGPFFGNPRAGLLTRIRNIGFGYDVVSGAYKVVELISRAGAIMAKVCTLGKDTSSSSSLGWRKGETFTSLPVHSVYSETAVCYEGVCYWLALFEFSPRDRHQMVLCFDMYAEKFEAVSLPSGLRLVPGLARWKESIIFFREPEEADLALEVWVMSTAKAEKRWTNNFSIAFDNCTAFRALKPVGFWKNGDELLIDLNLKGFCNVISYNVVENKYTHICCEASDESRLLYYFESFVAI